jgi:acyl-CoA dehydrogenase
VPVTDALTAEEVRAALASLVRPRRAGAGVMFGAGNDDLEAGRSYLAALAAEGWMVPTWPVDCGGRGAGSEEASVIRAALAEFDVPDLYPFAVGLSLVGPTLLAHATDEQCRRWLPAVAGGAEIWCQLFSEPDAGSDLAGLACRAVRDGDRWRVDGTKVWSSRAHYADWGFLLARTDATVPKHAGITAFVLDMDAPGVDVRPMTQMNGDRHFNEVFLTGAVVPDVDRIGAEGQGWRIALTMLAHERAALGVGGGGGPGGGGPVEAVIELAQTTGRASDPVVRQRLAALVAADRAGRWTAARARAASRGGRPGPEGSGIKLAATTVLRQVAELGIDLLGPAGTLGDGEWLTRFLTGPSLSIRGGTDEIQRNIIGERTLGLPAEPRVDRELPFAEVRRSRPAAD